MVVINSGSPSNRSEARNPKFALLIIDMQDMYYSDIRSVHYGVPKLDALKDVICFARKAGISIHFLEFCGAGNTFGNLTALTTNPTRHLKFDLDGFTNPSFRIAMAQFENLVVGGYSYSACVYETIKSAVGLGLKVVTSPDLLFYSRYSASSYPERENRATAFYESNVSMAKNVHALIESIS